MKLEICINSKWFSSWSTLQLFNSSSFIICILSDLQLAAELGRSLLDRNEELENEVKTQQILIDDQAQEILVSHIHLSEVLSESLFYYLTFL